MGFWARSGLFLDVFSLPRRLPLGRAAGSPLLRGQPTHRHQPHRQNRRLERRHQALAGKAPPPLSPDQPQIIPPKFPQHPPPPPPFLRRSKTSSPSTATTPPAPSSSSVATTVPSTTWVSAAAAPAAPIGGGGAAAAIVTAISVSPTPRCPEVPPAHEGQRPPGDGALPRPNRRRRHRPQRLPHPQNQ